MFCSKLYARTSVQAVSYRVPMIVSQVCRDKDGFFRFSLSSLPEGHTMGVYVLLPGMWSAVVLDLS